MLLPDMNPKSRDKKQPFNHQESNGCFSQQVEDREISLGANGIDLFLVNLHEEAGDALRPAFFLQHPEAFVEAAHQSNGIRVVLMTDQMQVLT